MPSEAVKLSVNLPHPVVTALRAYASEHGITMTEAIRQALGLQMFINKEVAEGAKVLLEHKGGDLRQLVTP